MVYITSGTKEWAASNVNIYFGCENNCKFCYAKKMAIRFGRKTEETWKEMILNTKAFKKNYKKRDGRIMYPSSHDITSKTLDNSIIVLKKLLKAGNEVLIVSKPDLCCIYALLNNIEEFKAQVEFRFTITSLRNLRLKFWEPNAPNIFDRLQSLQLAYNKGFKTSVSIEPFLDKNPLPLIITIAPYSSTIWLGKMNYISYNNNISDKEQYFYKLQRETSSFKNIQLILKNIKKLPEGIQQKIRLKDSIVNLFKMKGIELATEVCK